MLHIKYVCSELSTPYLATYTAEFEKCIITASRSAYYTVTQSEFSETR